jgi:hypothetical protein
MLTYTQLYTEVADNCGFSAATASRSLTNAQRHINLALRKFKNASRRYWTRKEVTTNLVAGQQYYTFPEDMVRVTTVKVTSGGLTLPVTMIDSEELWNRINLIPAMTVGIPTQGFIRGRNEIGLYPVPSTNYTNGLIVSYESRQKDMTIDDLTSATLNVTNGAVSVAASSGTPFNQNMVGQWLSVTDGSDGNWYQITGYIDTTHITLENFYQGPTKTGVASIIASAPDIPEDFHQALVDYASYRYFLKRKDKDTAADYKSLYDEALRDYRKIYAAKTTGVTQDDLTPYSYNMFGLPPQNVTS